MYDFETVPSNSCKQRQIHEEGRKPLSNSLLLSSMNAPVQRVVMPSVIAIKQAGFKAGMLQSVGGVMGPINYIDAMANYRALGFSIDIFQVAPSAPPALANPKDYFEDCIRVYYGEPQTGADLVPAWLSLHPGMGLGSDAHSYAAGNPTSLLGSSLAGPGFSPAVTGQLAPLTAALQSVLFPALSPYKFHHWRRLPAAGTTFQYQNPDRIRRGPTRKSSQGGLKIANLVMERPDLQLPPVRLRKNPAHAAGSYAGRINNPHQHEDRLQYNPDTAASRSHTRTFVHELGHHLEANLGTEDMVRLYRGLYARTFPAPVSPPPHRETMEWGAPHAVIAEPGIRQVGKNAPSNRFYGLNLFLPPTGITPGPGGTLTAPGGTAEAALENESDQQSYLSQKYCYPGTVSTYTDTAGAFTPSSTYSTEFLSTTSEMMTRPRNARLLVETDPLRVALFLKIANPRIYAEVQKQFAGNLDALLHVD